MTTPTLLTQAEIDAVRRPYRSARLLPGRAYHDPAFYAFERERFFGRDWQMVARAGSNDAARNGRRTLAIS